MLWATCVSSTFLFEGADCLVFKCACMLCEVRYTFVNLCVRMWQDTTVNTWLDFTLSLWGKDVRKQLSHLSRLLLFLSASLSSLSLFISLSPHLFLSPSPSLSPVSISLSFHLHVFACIHIHVGFFFFSHASPSSLHETWNMKHIHIVKSSDTPLSCTRLKFNMYSAS